MGGFRGRGDSFSITTTNMKLALAINNNFKKISVFSRFNERGKNLEIIKQKKNIYTEISMTIIGHFPLLPIEYNGTLDYL